MKYYACYLQEHGIRVTYIEATTIQCDIKILLSGFRLNGIGKILYYDVCDNWLEKKIIETCHRNEMERVEYPTPLFINTKDDLNSYFGTRQKYFQTNREMNQHL